MTFRFVSRPRVFARRLTGVVVPLVLLLGCSFPLWAQVSKTSPEVKALLDQARAARTAHKNELALDLYAQARSRALDTEDKVGEAAALVGTGNIHSDQGQSDKALAAYEQARRLYTAAGDKPNAAVVEINLGRVYLRTGDTAKALGAYQSALPVFQATGDKASEAAALSGIGAVYLKQEQFTQAAASYQKAVPLYHAQGNKPAEGAALSGWGEVYRRQGQAAKAVPLYEQALALFRSVGDKPNEALVLSNLGATYISDGYISQGASTYEQAQAVYAALGDATGQAQALSGRADAYLSIGQNAKALTALQQALAVFQNRKDAMGEADVQLKLGQAYRQLSQPTNALTAYQHAQELSHSSGNTAAEGLALNGMGKVYFATDQYAKALKPYQQALTLFRASGDRSNEAVALTNIGNAYLNSNQSPKALQYYKQALPIFVEQSNQIGAAHTLGHIGDVEAELGHLSNSLTAYGQAVSNLEKVRTSLAGDTAQHVSSADRDIYLAYLQLLLEQKKFADAFAVTQKVKAFNLSNITAATLSPVDISGLTAEEQQQVTALQQQAAAIDRQLSSEEGKTITLSQTQRATLSAERRTVAGKQQALTAAVYARRPDLADVHGAKPASLADAARFLAGDNALLEYVQTTPDTLTLFVVTRGATGTPQISVSSIAFTDSLRQQCNSFRAACADPRKPYQPLARQLYTALLGPVQKQITAKKRLMIGPDGLLWDVPFSALLAPGDRFVNQAWEVDYAPSASGLQAARNAQQRRKSRPAPANTLLVLASPDLGSADRLHRIDDTAGPLAADKPSQQMAAVLERNGQWIPLSQSQKEADTVGAVFPGATILSGESMKEASVVKALGNYRYLHATSYSFLSDTAPLSSNIVLSQPPSSADDTDGFLTARELSEMQLSAELVTLSTASIGRSPAHLGDGMAGISWAWLAANVPTQIVSRWIADAPTTPALMGRFYTTLKIGGSKGDALRRAMLSVAQDKTHQHPYYWASFTLFGDWR